jgi:hypothetical protein
MLRSRKSRSYIASPLDACMSVVRQLYSLQFRLVTLVPRYLNFEIFILLYNIKLYYNDQFSCRSVRDVPRYLCSMSILPKFINIMSVLDLFHLIPAVIDPYRSAMMAHFKGHLKLKFIKIYNKFLRTIRYCFFHIQVISSCTSYKPH